MALIDDLPRLLPNTEGPRFIAVAHNKGGVGKTTEVNLLAHGFALHGLKVLVLEKEGSPRLWQINTPGFDYMPDPRTSQTTYGLLEYPERGMWDGVYTIKTNELLASIPSLHADARARLIAERHWGHAVPFFMLPGHSDMDILITQLNDIRKDTGENVELRMARALQTINAWKFDVILMDTPPTSNLLQTIALKAQYRRDQPGVAVILPVDFDPSASRHDFRLAEAKIKRCQVECREEEMPAPYILGVAYNLYDDETAAEIDDRLYREYTQIHENLRTRQPEDPLIPYPQLGFLKKSGDIKRSLERSQSLHTLTPTKESGIAAYHFVCTVEQALGLGRFIAA